MGAVSPIGVGTPEFVRSLRAGRSGVARLDPAMPGHDRIRSSVAAMCTAFNPSTVMSAADQRRLPQMVPKALAAAREAMGQAGLLEGTEAQRDRGTEGKKTDRARGIGLILGTGAGGIDFTLDQAEIGYGPAGERARQPSLWTITNATHGNLAGELSIRLGLRGPSLCTSTGCASSSDALGLALETLRSARPGRPEIMVVVGADAHVRWETLLGMEMLRVISTRDFAADGLDPATASRPFDISRDGFVLGEGAWAMVLEREEIVRRREVRPLAVLAGYGVTCDAYHRVRPDPEMGESARAMALAIEDAGLAPGDIDLIHYHGTATAVNDAAETVAVHRAFGEYARRLRGTSIKGAIGHPQGACGIAAAVASIGALAVLDGDARGPFVPPTINLHEPDVEGGCDLDYTPRAAAPADGARTLMVNCLAFGAKNSALVFAVPE